MQAMEGTERPTVNQTARRISVVAPVFNSSGSLRPLVERLEPVLAQVAADYEIVLVNDGSVDDSAAVVSTLARENGSVRGVDLMRNYGQHNALLAGILESRFETIITIDDDLQNPPEEIPALLAKLDEGFDVVYGTPIEERHQVWRVLASEITKLVLQNAMGADTARKVSAFRVFRARVADAFRDFANPYVNIDVLLTWGTARFASIPVRHDPRAHGTSNYTWRRLTRHALDMMTGFSTFPLRVASLVGFAFTLFGVVILAFVLGRYLYSGGSVPGFPFLASIIALFSGAQLFALGVIGEYLGRIHFGSMSRPAFVVRQSFGPDPETEEFVVRSKPAR
jgi:undecaprenyl-phosphate 4-deoxy-4-formamido-L-arabinose transferase